ncbi:hypothetical protein MMC25_004904 [Agyrium rufum]|nr:hypothetical protein [Agyrium rufum]
MSDFVVRRLDQNTRRPHAPNTVPEGTQARFYGGPPPKKRKVSVDIGEAPIIAEPHADKPKQTKSRTGCITCKAKRLKCDETKPTCLKCQKRNVVCEGYKKEWKWKLAEKDTFRLKGEESKARRGSVKSEDHTSPISRNSSGPSSIPAVSQGFQFDNAYISNAHTYKRPSSRQTSQDPTLKVSYPCQQSHPDYVRAQVASSPMEPYVSQCRLLHGLPSISPAVYQLSNSNFIGAGSQPLFESFGSFESVSDSPHMAYPFERDGEGPRRNREADEQEAGTGRLQFDTSLSNNTHEKKTPLRQTSGGDQYPSDVNSISSYEENSDRRQASSSATSTPPSRSLSQSPTIAFMLNDDATSPLDLRIGTPTMSHQDSSMSYNSDPGIDLMDIEEVQQNPPPTRRNIMIRSFSQSSSSSGSSASTERDVFDFLWRPPVIDPTSPDALTQKFLARTCGILSVKDGPNENPWRTLIWPLAQQSPALRHALLSMSAFHESKMNGTMMRVGIKHSTHSFRLLREELSAGQPLTTVAALATTLSLAFSESWNERSTSTGMQHLNAAKAMIDQARRNLGRIHYDSNMIACLKFLLNTYVYMAVIARLISINDTGSDDFSTSLSPSWAPSVESAEIDPLLGCAGTLYPLIGRVTKLVGRVRRCSRNSSSILQEGRILKALIEDWQPPLLFEPVEDPTLADQHSLSTAEAYRSATLLYLHQAVPEIESETSLILAKRTLQSLASIPLSSGAVIIHIFPLLAAGCEVDDMQTRVWVEDRWRDMSRRMWIRNLDRCLEVTQEVWSRRDALCAADELDLSVANALPLMPSLLTHSSDESTFSIDGPSPLDGLAQGIGGLGSYPPGTFGFFPSFSRTDRISGFQACKRERLISAKTARGKAHWVGVMEDWGWEVLLG